MKNHGGIQKLPQKIGENGKNEVGANEPPPLQKIRQVDFQGDGGVSIFNRQFLKACLVTTKTIFY